MAYNRETKMWEGYIYKIVNDVNDIIYIGQTITTLYLRFNKHKSTAKNMPESCNIASAINQYGIDHFEICEIEKIQDIDKKYVEDMLNKREIGYIARCKAEGIELYNMTKGGDSQGNTFSEKPVIQYDLFCKKINCYPSAAEAALRTGVARSDISACCLKTGKIHKAGNYIWRYLCDPLTNEEIIHYQKKYPGICQYDFDGNLLNTFYTIIEAKNYLNQFGLNGSNISGCCRGCLKSVDGFVWRYKHDPFDKYKLPKKHRMIEQRDYITGKLIAKYNSCKEAGEKTGFDDSGINQCCNGNTRSSNGYIWCYEGDMYVTKHMRNGIPIDMYDNNMNYIKTFNATKQVSIDTGISRYSILKSCKENCMVYNYYFKYHSKTSRKEVKE